MKVRFLADVHQLCKLPSSVLYQHEVRNTSVYSVGATNHTHPLADGIEVALQYFVVGSYVIDDMTCSLKNAVIALLFLTLRS